MSLSLSASSTALPSLQVDEERVRKANKIFEKEQEAAAERAVAEKAEQPSNLFVNANGYGIDASHEPTCIADSSFAGS